MAKKGRTVFLAFDVPLEVEQNYVFEIWKAFARSLYITRQKLAPLKIATRHYTAMAILASSDHSATQSTLVKRMGLSPNVVLGMVDYLDRLGYTKRVRNPRNRRENIVLLSEKGRNAYDQAFRLLKQAEQEFLSSLSGEECKQFLDITKKLGESVPSIRDLAIDLPVRFMLRATYTNSWKPCKSWEMNYTRMSSFK
jgi:DNA-binding MarR family transcriptional regulator